MTDTALTARDAELAARTARARRFYWWVLGVSAAVSVLGNALHAWTRVSGENPPAQLLHEQAGQHVTLLPPVVAAVLAALVPISLLVHTHGLALLASAPSKHGWLSKASVLGVILVLAAGGFYLSFDALRELAMQCGFTHDQAWVMPILLDGSIGGATIALLTLPAADDATTTAAPESERAAAPAIGPRADQDAATAFEELTSELEAEFAARGPIAREATEPARDEPAARAETPIADRAREALDRAPIAAPNPIAARADQTAVSEREAAEPSAVPEREDAPAPIADPAPVAHGAARAIAAHIPAEQDSTTGPIAAHELGPVAPAIGPHAQDDTEQRAVVSLVRSPRASEPVRGFADRRARGARSPRAEHTGSGSSIARAIAHSPRAEAARGARAANPFGRELSRAEAAKLARAVTDRRLSKQPVEVLARIYHDASRAEGSLTGIADQVGLPHSTVIRAVDAAHKVSGPRAVD